MTCAGCLRHGLQRLGVRLEVTEAVLNHLSGGKLTPVAFPPGRLRLETKPSITGSPPVTNTIGTVVFADFAASADSVFPTIRATCWRTKSATRAGNRWS